MEYFSWKRFKLSPPLIKELTQQFRRPARALLVAFGPADLEEPPGCFFPFGFSFLGPGWLFVAHRMDFLPKARPLAGPAGI